MEKQPFFSIIVPTYNQAQYLPHALDSIVVQTDTDWEAVVIDDGSTDETPEILREYSIRHKNLRTFRKENGGTASALNRGLEEARGKWICWLSSDDMFDARKLEINRREIGEHPDVDFFFSYFRLLNEYTGELTDHELWGPLPEPEFYVLGLFYRNYVNGITICVRRDSFAKVGFFDLNLKYAQDYDMWLRLLSVFTGRFIPEWTVISRNHALQGSEVFPQACIYDTAKAAIRFINNTPFEGLFPGLNLGRKENASRSLSRALDIAADPHSFVYWIGPHPALLLRIAEWIDRKGERDDEATEQFDAMLQKKTLEIGQNGDADRFSFMWRVIAAARKIQCTFIYDSVSPKSVGEIHYYSVSSVQAAESEPLRRYLEQYEGTTIDDPQLRVAKREIVFVVPVDITDKEILKSQTFHPIRVAAESLVMAGASVILLGLGRNSVRYHEGMFLVFVSDSQAQRRLLSSLAPLDVVITCGDQGREVPSSSVRIIYDPSTTSIKVKGMRTGRQSLARPSKGSDLIPDKQREFAARLLETIQANGVKRQGRSRLIEACAYVRRKTASLLSR